MAALIKNACLVNEIKVVKHDHSGVFRDGWGEGPMDPKDFATKQELKDTK
ncbi:hypothetical protein G8J22_02353 [Lentilactobacillus hilgardii]|nr:hypothetical protein [Lentilactobacillus hilgardii]EEI19527.1 hypothetical protein HMPREF0497_1653 [Lentilactobacillus buchneri ATCC 11577]QIR10345.1 hypothetical protein G8J22_02353 [Lentilactobacillus hilgardii]